MKHQVSFTFNIQKKSSLTLKSQINENKPISLKYFLDDWTINKFSGYAKRKDGLILRGKIDLISDYMTIVIENILDNDDLNYLHSIPHMLYIKYS